MKPTGLTRFTIFEADYALYEVTGDDAPLGNVFLGAAMEKVSLGGHFEEVQFRYQGDPVGETRHTDEAYEIEISSPLTVQRRPGLAERIGSIGAAFNRRFLFVVTWYDKATTAWFKRIYRGVTAQPAKLAGSGTGGHQGGGPVMEQVLRFHAQRMTESSGHRTKPSLAASRTGQVRYVSVTENLTLYTYDGDTGAFAPADPALLAGRATIVAGPDSVEITFDATLALRAEYLDGVFVHGVLDGQTFADAVPRLEFWIDGVRRGSLTQAGLLVASSFVESEDDPEDAAALRFEDTDGRWLFSLGTALTTPALADTL